MKKQDKINEQELIEAIANIAHILYSEHGNTTVSLRMGSEYQVTLVIAGHKSVQELKPVH